MSPRRTIDGRLQAAEERVAKDQERARKLRREAARTAQNQDTSRKVLIGTFVLDEVASGSDHGEIFGDILRERLPELLTRRTDRALLGEFLDDTDDEPDADPDVRAAEKLTQSEDDDGPERDG